MQGKFEKEWESLAVVLDEKDNVAAADVQWFRNLVQKRKKFAATWTYQHFTAAVHSTQRCESVHAALKHIIKASSLLTDLAKSVDVMVADMKNRQEASEVWDMCKTSMLSVTKNALATPQIDAVSEQVTPFALDLIRSQYAQAGWYEVEDVDDEEGLYEVTRVPKQTRSVTVELDVDTEAYKKELSLMAEKSGCTHRASPTSCSCQYHVNYGLPCRHQFAVIVRKGLFTVPFEDGCINPFWLKKTDLEIVEARLEMDARRLASTRESAVEEGRPETSKTDILEAASEHIKSYTHALRKLPHGDLAVEADKVIGFVVHGLKRMNRCNTKGAAAAVAAKKKSEKAVPVNPPGGVAGVSQAAPTKRGRKESSRKTTWYDRKGKRGEKRPKGG